MTEYFGVLKSCSLFRDIAEADYALLLECLEGQARSYPKGGAIFRAGEPAVRVGVVLQGSVRVCREDADGNRNLLAAIGPGGLFGEAYACAETAVLPVSVWAEEHCRILLLELGRVSRPCATSCAFHHRLVRNLLRVLAEKNVFLTGKLEHMGKRMLREKLLSYLREREAAEVCPSPAAEDGGRRAFTVPFDRQGLADYLCVDRSALSRELGKLRGEGVVAFEKNRFWFL